MQVSHPSFGGVPFVLELGGEGAWEGQNTFSSAAWLAQSCCRVSWQPVNSAAGMQFQHSVWVQVVHLSEEPVGCQISSGMQ